MKEKIEKELIKYYIEKEKLVNSTNKKDIIKLDIINTVIKRIKFIIEIAKYEDYTDIIEFEKLLLDKNLSNNIDEVDSLYILKWLEYSKFLYRVNNVNTKKILETI